MRSIRFQFITFILAVLIMLLVLLNISPITSSRDQIFEEKRASLSSRAAVISSYLGGLDTFSRDTVGDVLSYLDVEELSGIVVTDASGTVVYESGSGEDCLPELATVLDSKTVFRSSFDSARFASIAVCPISRQNMITGAVGIVEYDTERAEMLVQMQSRIRYLSLAIGTVALLAVILFSEVLVHRIRLLVGSVKTVAGGDYAHRLTVRGRDEIAQLGDEFNSLTERLETTEKQRRQFVADASHELKTPLAAIRLLSDSVVQNENVDADTMREFMTDICSEADRLQRTTEKLLDLSRLDDDVHVEPEPVDLKQTVLDAMSMLLRLAEEKDVALRSELEEGCVVMATGEDLFHIVFNLAENAIKYNVPGGSVRICTALDGDTVRLAVEDTGIGIPEEDRLNVFSRFYRVDKARSREAGGSGLGLSIVHDAVQAHGGTITIGSNKPQGTRFVVEFPRPSSEETGI